MTAVTALTAVTGQAFVTRPGVGMGDSGRRSRCDYGSSVPVAIVMAAVTAVIAELWPARDVSAVGCCGPSLSGSGGGRGEAIRNIYYSDRQLPPGHDPGADSGDAPTAGSVRHFGAAATLGRGAKCVPTRLARAWAR
jgi:hypothetical protein